MIAAASQAATRGTPRIELAEVFHRYGDAYQREHRLRPAQRKVVRAIRCCRTAALGGQCDWCSQCGFLRYVYHSCRNRHCPKCQTLAKQQWLQLRHRELLPTPYFHNVFTLPHELNPLILGSEQNQRLLLGLLFHAAAETLLQFGRHNLGGQVGFTLILHTWDQQLRPHFHVHAVIAAGALSRDGQRWVAAGRQFLFPVRALSKVFRGKFLEGLRELVARGQLTPALPDFQRRLRRVKRNPWIVYSKAPFAGPEKLLDYLGRYTHRVAISNHRLLSIDDGQVSFHWRDRSDGDRRKVASLPASQFLRRFLYHVLPKGFMRIRHYGFLANSAKDKALARCREQLHVSKPSEEPVTNTTADAILRLTGIDIMRCPRCRAPLTQTEFGPYAEPTPKILNAVPYLDSS